VKYPSLVVCETLFAFTPRPVIASLYKQYGKPCPSEAWFKDFMKERSPKRKKNLKKIK
jgi:hypothetical protein